MVPMPADQFALSGIRLFEDAIVNDEYSVFGLDFPRDWFDPLPQVGRGEGFRFEKPTDRIMTDGAVQYFRKTGCRCQTKGTNKIVAVEVNNLGINVIFHTTILPIRNRR